MPAVASKPHIEVCLSPMLAGSLDKDPHAVVVVTDVLRATTSMLAALMNGATAILPVASLDQAAALRDKGFLVAAERGGGKVDFAHFGNSPLELKPGLVSGKKIVFTTTNGTQAIDVAPDLGSTIAIGAFINISALARWLIGQNRHVVVLCSGWHGAYSLEDTAFAGALAEQLTASGDFSLYEDAAHGALDLWKAAKHDPAGYLKKAMHVRRLQMLGLDRDIEFALRADKTGIVAVLEGNEIKSLL